MKRPFALAFVAVALVLDGAGAQPLPFRQDPLGPIVDVTKTWQRYQPAAHFCVRPNVIEASGGTGARTTGRIPTCRASGFGAGARGLYQVRIRTPLLCAGCRRLFLDYSRIRPNAPPEFFAHGHAYFRLLSFNQTYTIDPRAHSPNIKTLTNDDLVAPPGSPQQQTLVGFDMKAMTFVADTANTAHSSVQGPYYVGPWYVNRAGKRIVGAYIDLDAGDAQQLPDPTLNQVAYGAGFNSGEATCPDNVVAGGAYRDGDYYYGGCVDHFGGSSGAVDPFGK